MDDIKCKVQAHIRDWDSSEKVWIRDSHEHWVIQGYVKMRWGVGIFKGVLRNMRTGGRQCALLRVLKEGAKG